MLAAALAVVPVSMAQFYSTAHDARSGAMGGCLFMPEKKYAVMLDYRQGWLLSGLADKRIELSIPAGRGVATAGYMHRGNIEYCEQQIGATYGMDVADWLTVGIGARYLYSGSADPHYKIGRYVGTGVMARFLLSQRTTTHFVLQTRPWDPAKRFGMNLQMTYRPSRELLTAVELESERVWRVRAGMEYCYEEMFFFRTGFATNPFVATFGIGFKYGAFVLDLSVEAHNVLGVSPQTSLKVWF